MGIKRVVDTQFWTDDKVIEIFSPEDKLFMLYLMTNPHTTQLGIYKVSKKIMAFETGYSTDTISVLLDRFETKYELIKYSDETKEVAIKNYLRHSIIKGGKPVEDLLIKEISMVKDKSLLQYVFNGISTCETLNGTVTGILPLLNQNANEIHNDNDNDNDNDVSYHDSYNDSSPNRSNSDSDQLKPLYGSLGRGLVLLTDNQKDDLIEKLNLTEFDTYVSKMADLIEKGYNFRSSHYQYILKMVDEDRAVR